MLIFPAIDIQNRQCVRLVKGDFATAHRVAEDPLATAPSLPAGRGGVDPYGGSGRRQNRRENQRRYFQSRGEGQRPQGGAGRRDPGYGHPRGIFCRRHLPLHPGLRRSEKSRPGAAGCLRFRRQGSRGDRRGERHGGHRGVAGGFPGALYRAGPPDGGHGGCAP